MEFLYLLLFAFNSFGALFLMVIGFTVLEKNRNRGGIFFFIFSIGYGIYQLLSQITEAGFDSFSLKLLNLLTMSGSIVVILTAPLLFFSILYLLNSAYQFKAVHILILIPVIPALITVLILGMIGEYGIFFFTEQNVIFNSLFLASHTLYMTVYITAG